MAFIGGADRTIIGQAGQTAAGNNILLQVAGTAGADISGYKSVAIQIIPTGTVTSGTVTFEASNDGTSFVALYLYDAANLGINPVNSVNPATGIITFFQGPTYWQYIRARISTVIGGGGSLQAITTLSLAGFQPTEYAVVNSVGSLINKPFATPANDWTYVPPVAGINNTTTAVTVKAAAGAGIRNYITGLQYSVVSNGADTVLAIRDGAGGTVLWRGAIDSTGSGAVISARFETPLRGTANTLLEIVTLTASNNNIFVNLQGFTAA